MQSNKSGHSFKAKNGFLKVAKGSLVVRKGWTQNWIYSLIGSTVIGDYSNVTHADVNKTRL